jgi:hypothetical protein
VVVWAVPDVCVATALDRVEVEVVEPDADADVVAEVVAEVDACVVAVTAAALVSLV